jgi:tRNA-uridine 2-sulfurtransferase
LSKSGYNEIMSKKNTKATALLLFSGGLDSMLAVKILEEQGIKVKLISFTGFFFDEKEAKTGAKILKKRLKIIDISQKHLKVVESPKYGYGKGLNPCLDCHLLMIKEAKKLLKKENCLFLATGEVVSQRLKSQKLDDFKIIEKQVKLNNKIVRPLSAQLLEPTIWEQKGIINRDKLFGITGKSRKEQIALAKKFKIKNYPSPAGGCILTEPNFGKNLKSIIDYKKIDKTDIELLKSGRVFTKENIKIIIGRNHKENLKINKLAKKDDVLMEAKDIPGPLTLIRFYEKLTKKEKDGILNKSAKLTKHYSTKTKNLDKVKIRYWKKGNKKNLKIIII